MAESASALPFDIIVLLMRSARKPAKMRTMGMPMPRPTPKPILVVVELELSLLPAGVPPVELGELVVWAGVLVLVPVLLVLLVLVMMVALMVLVVLENETVVELLAVGATADWLILK